MTKMTNEELLELKTLADLAHPFEPDEALDAVFSSDDQALVERVKANFLLFIDAKKRLPGIIDELLELRKQVS